MSRAYPFSLWATLFVALFAFNLVQGSHFDRRVASHRRHHVHARQANDDGNITSTSIISRSLAERAAPSGWNLFIKSGNDGGGCYVDNASARLLTGYSAKDVNNGLQSCLNTCQSKGFTYGGVQYGVECFVSPVPSRSRSKRDHAWCID